MQTHLEFVVGEEKRLNEIISRTEIEPLLRSLVKAGVQSGAVLDEDHLLICQEGISDPLLTTATFSYSLLVEGEPKGELRVATNQEGQVAVALATLVRDALQLMINNNLKRMLTTEIHTAIVQESYQQLVESNKQLTASECRYRELAISLEQQVQERTLTLQQTYSRMLQQEKLAAVGSLAAGMAHEINNPNGFIRSNISTFGRYFERLKEMLNHMQLLIAANTPLLQLQHECETLRKKLKLDFVMSDVAQLEEQSLSGCDRIARIVASLKSFSHVDETGLGDANINDELDNLLVVLTPQIPPDGDIIRESGLLPLFPCNPGLLAQAFLSIIQNALLSRPSGLHVRIGTAFEGGQIVVTIADNGCGIPDTDLSRVFDPFFTTREVGSGTGMGLTVAREIIQGVGGAIELVSSLGKGTVVTIRLPVKG